MPGITRQEQLRRLLLAEPASFADLCRRTGWAGRSVEAALACGRRAGMVDFANDQLGRRCYFVPGFAPDWLRTLPGALLSPEELLVMQRESFP